MPENRSYDVTELNENVKTKPCTRTGREEVYNYDEAIDLAGNGFYTITLLLTLSMGTLSMAVDIFGFSVVVSGARCDLNLDLHKTGILLSVSFIGPIIMAYPWGYISDTQGRKKSLLISLWTSLIVSLASAFSPDWVTMAVLKFISTSFSSCGQSATYTLLGESCPCRMRDAYMLMMTSVLDFSMAIYVAIAYGILNLEFSYDLGFIVFTPWRLLALALTLPLGLGAVGALFFYESPRFLLYADRHDEAVEALAGIWKRNGRKEQYPVKTIRKEESSVRRKDRTIMQSLWEQLVPVVKPPLLWRSIQLYFLTGVLYGTNNSYFIWFPFLANKFIDGLNSITTNDDTGLCDLIVSAYDNTTSSSMSCSSTIDISLLWFSLVQGVCFVLILLSITRIAHRKRILVIIIFLVSGLSALGAVLIKEKFTGLVMFFGMIANQLVIGFIYSYYVDLYPTSYRGMAACIGTMVARSSALVGTTLLGDFIMTHCSHTFYVCSSLMMCAVFVGILLPKNTWRRTNS